MKRPWSEGGCCRVSADATFAAIKRRTEARRCVDEAVAAFLGSAASPSDRRAMMDALEGKWQDMLRDRIASESAAQTKEG